MPAKTLIDTEAVQALATVLENTGLSEIEYEVGDLRIRLARGRPMAETGISTAAPSPAPSLAAASPSATPTPEDLAKHPGAVTSPMVGVVYTCPEPGAAPFVTVGSVVSEGQTLLLIEAMKTFNPIQAPRGGKVTRIIAANGAPVEYGEPLIIIE